MLALAKKHRLTLLFLRISKNGKGFEDGRGEGERVA
jgi:hypothetical protein